MTHFVGLVICNSEEEIEQLVAPYSEHLKVDPYKEYIDDQTMERFTLWCEENKYAPDTTAEVKYFGEELYKDEVGAYTLSNYNPKSRWDWYVIGGRWDDLLPNHKGTGAEAIAALRERWPETPHASTVVDVNGWHEEHRHGWFGTVVSDSDQNWPEKFNALIENAPNVFVVDFHI